jgi:uncharacterized membrane protein
LSEDSLERRLDNLEARLARIENRLDSLGRAQQQSNSADPSQHAASDSASESAHAKAEPDSELITTESANEGRLASVGEGGPQSAPPTSESGQVDVPSIGESDAAGVDFDALAQHRDVTPTPAARPADPTSPPHVPVPLDPAPASSGESEPPPSAVTASTSATPSKAPPPPPPPPLSPSPSLDADAESIEEESAHALPNRKRSLIAGMAARAVDDDSSTGEAPATLGAPPTRLSTSVPADDRGATSPRLAKRSAARSSGQLESTIGSRWFAWIGAVLLVLSVGTLIRLAYVRGWFGEVPIEIRLGASAAFGLFLVIAGEAVLRYVGRVASVGLFGAGIAIMYVTTWASFNYYDLISSTAGLVLLAIIAFLGFGITLRGRMLSIGVLSILGGYAAPMLANDQVGVLTSLMPAYLTVILIISLGLSAFLSDPFRPLRYVALGAHGFVATVWTFEAELAPTLVFVSIWWGLVLAESLYAAYREQSAVGNVSGVLLASAWYATVGCLILSARGAGLPVPGTTAISMNWTGIFIWGAAAAAAVVAAQCSPNLDHLRRRPRNALEALCLSLWIIAGVMLATGVALHFDGYGQTISWLAIGLASIEIGRQLRSRGVDVFGLIVGGLAILRVITLDQIVRASGAGIGAVLAEFDLGSAGTLQITGWTIIAVIAIMVLHLAAHRFRTTSEGWSRFLPVQLVLLATAGWVLIAELECTGLATTGTWLTYVVILLIFRMWGVGTRQRYLEIAAMFVGLTAMRWLFADAILNRFGPSLLDEIDIAFEAPSMGVVLKPQLGMAVAITAVGWWTAMIWRRKWKPSADDSTVQQIVYQSAWQVLMCAGMAFLLIAGSFEVERWMIEVRAAQPDGFLMSSYPYGYVLSQLLTLLWGLGAGVVAILARILCGPKSGMAVSHSADREIPAPPSLVAGFASLVLVGCTVKWVLYDTLYWWITTYAEGWTADATAILNIQAVVGVVLFACWIAIHYILRNVGAEGKKRAFHHDITSRAIVIASAVLIWLLTFELERILTQWVERQPEGWGSPFPMMHHRMLWWTLLWSIYGGLLLGIAALWRAQRERLASAGGLAIMVTALIWVGFGAFLWRTMAPIANVQTFINIQALSGVSCIAMLAIGMAFLRKLIPDRLDESAGVAVMQRGDVSDTPIGSDRTYMHIGLPTVPLMATLIGLIGLGIGTLELERLFTYRVSVSDPSMFVQTSWSIFWGLYSIALIALGFARRLKSCRLAGMGLMAITLLKVLVVDMSDVDTGLRVLSLFALGVIFVVVSIAYTRWESRVSQLRSGDGEGDEDERDETAGGVPVQESDRHPPTDPTIIDPGHPVDEIPGAPHHRDVTDDDSGPEFSR